MNDGNTGPRNVLYSARHGRRYGSIALSSKEPISYVAVEAVLDILPDESLRDIVFEAFAEPIGVPASTLLPGLVRDGTDPVLFRDRSREGVNIYYVSDSDYLEIGFQRGLEHTSVVSPAYCYLSEDSELCYVEVSLNFDKDRRGYEFGLPFEPYAPAR